jgi:hypothetical protein
MTIEVNEKDDNVTIRRLSDNGLAQPKDIQPGYEVVEEIKIKYEEIPDKKSKDTGPNILVLILWIYLGVMLFASLTTGGSPPSVPYYNDPLPQYPTEPPPNFIE